MVDDCIEQTEQALRESEDRYRRLFELCPAAVFVHSGGMIVLINTAGAKLLGAERPGQLVGKPVLEVVHPDYHEAVRQRMAAIREGGSVGLMEQKIVRLDGRVVDVEVTAGPFVYHDRPAIQVIARDISIRKRLEFKNAQILQLSHRLNSATTPRDAALIIAETADTLLGWDACHLDLYSSEEDKVFALLTMDEIDGEHRHVPPISDRSQPTSFARRVLREGGCIILREAGKIEDLGLVRFGDVSRVSASMLFARIRNGDRATGIMSIQSYEEHAYTKEDLALLEFLADHCAGALERLRAQEALRESEAQLHSLAAHQQKVREEERIRLAREIHDELGQLLTAFKYDLSWLGNRFAALPDETMRVRCVDRVQSMCAMVDEMVDSVRRISAELRPGMLDYLGLVPAMEWQISEFQKRVDCQCHFESRLDATDLPQDHCTAVFRIFQETLTNVARHAAASRVLVGLEESAGQLILRIEDNGRGITDEQLADPKSLGLAGMRERATVVGGEFKIAAAPGRGTVATVRIPLQHTNLKPGTPPKT